MSRLAAVHRDRAAKRRDLALDRARCVVDGAAKEGVEISVIGSLARSDFRLHSDVDFFVHGDTDPRRRQMAERLVAKAFNGADVPYDIIYASDLTVERAREFLGGVAARSPRSACRHLPLKGGDQAR